MSVIGPRPQLVRDMVFMTNEQRMRHTAKPGLSGLAQVNGRNAIAWEDKIKWDLKYIENVSIAEDVRIIFETVKKAFIKQEGITQDDMATAEDFGDYLLRTDQVSLGLALNVGLKECKNELVARMDTDDCSKPDRCEKQLARFEEKPYLRYMFHHLIMKDYLIQCLKQWQLVYRQFARIVLVEEREWLFQMV